MFVLKLKINLLNVQFLIFPGFSFAHKCSRNIHGIIPTYMLRILDNRKYFLQKQYINSENVEQN